MVTQDLELPPLDAAQCIVAHVFSPEGLAVEKVDFQFGYHNKDNTWSNGVYATHRGPGTYWIVPPKGDGDQNPGPFAMPDTTVELTAHCAQYGTKSVPVTGPGREVEVRFGEPAKADRPRQDVQLQYRAKAGDSCQQIQVGAVGTEYFRQPATAPTP